MNQRLPAAFLNLDRPCLMPDDADGDGVSELERITNGHDPVARFELIGIAQRRKRQILGGSLQSEQGGVRNGITSYEPWRGRLSVAVPNRRTLMTSASTTRWSLVRMSPS